MRMQKMKKYVVSNSQTLVKYDSNKLYINNLPFLFRPCISPNGACAVVKVENETNSKAWNLAV